MILITLRQELLMLEEMRDLLVKIERNQPNPLDTSE
jgi:hypothetical protein